MKLPLSIALAATSIALSPIARADVSLHPGRYIGYLTHSGSEQKIALTFDLFAFKPDDPASFPEQRATLKIGLGGLQSSEYVTEFFENIQYDFANGVLTMGGATNDMSITAKVTGDFQSFIDGPVFIRSAATSGTIHLVELSDDPDAEPGTVPGDQYKPLLAGQYDGNCGSHQAKLQVEVARGLDPMGPDRHGMAPYRIIGRIGMVDQDVCLGQVCAVRNYTTGTFDIFRNRLVLTASNGPDDCQLSDDGVSCNVHLGSIASHCDFKREATEVPDPTFYSRSESIPTTADQMAPLPAPNPPGNTDLVAAAQGDFIGYLHNESTNKYQVFRMNVMAFSSTTNPHNENIVSVTGATILHFGKAVSDDFFVQQFEPHSLYLVPGFTLSSSASDGFLRVLDWRKGYIRGIWYSRAFGKIGSVELIRGTSLPPISDRAKFVPSIAGAYVGPNGSEGDMDNAWLFSLFVPTQSPTIDSSTLALLGQYEVRGGAIPRRAIDDGAFDFYSGSVAWEGAEGRVVTGNVTDIPSLQLFWPGIASFGILMPNNHNLYPYTHP